MKNFKLLLLRCVTCKDLNFLKKEVFLPTFLVTVIYI